MADDENITLEQMEIIATNSCPSVILSEGNTVIKTEPQQVTGLCPEGFAHFHERSKLTNTVTMPHPTPSVEQNNEDISLCSTTDVGDSNLDGDQLVKTLNAKPSGSTIQFQNTTPNVEGSITDRTPNGHQNYVDLIQSQTPIGQRIPLLRPNYMESNPQLLVYPNILIPLTDQESGSASESDIGINFGGGYGTGNSLSLHVKKERSEIFACDTLHQSTVCDSSSCNILPGLMKQEKSITIPCNSSFPTTSDQNGLTEVRVPTASEDESDSGNISSIAQLEAENVSPRNRKAKRTLDKGKACHPVLVNSEPSIKTRLRSRTDCSGKGPSRYNHNVTTTLKNKGPLKTSSCPDVVTRSELDQSEVSKPKRQCAKNTCESQSGERRSETAKPKNVKDLHGLKNPTSVTGSVNLEQSTDFTSAQTVSSSTSMVDFPASKKQKSTRGSNVRDLSSGSEPILNKRRKRLSTTKGSALKNAKTGKLEIAPQDSDLEQRRAPYTDQQRVSGLQQQRQQPAPSGYSWCKMMGKSLLAEFSCKNCKVSFPQKEIKRHVSKCTCKSTMKQTGNAKTTKPKLPDVEVFSKIIVSLDKNTREFHFECSVCGFSKLSRVRGVINHMLQHIEAKLFKCTECHRSYKTPSSLASHKISHTNKQSCYCKICGISFARPQAKRQHMVIHRRTSKDQMCEVCGKMFYDEIAAEFHKLVHSEKQFSCDICQRKFRRKGELISHKKLHAGKGLYACHLCTKQFSMQSSLNVHRKIHSGDLEFACHICSKRFAVRLHLKRHLAVHSDARPFKCHDCDRAFKVPDMLKCHLSVHSHPDTWPYRCDKCNRRFRLRPYLRYHKCKTN